MRLFQLLKNGIIVTESSSILELMAIIDKDISTDEAAYEIRQKKSDE